MIKQNKTKLTFILSVIFLATIITAGCNNSSDSAKTEKKDSAATAVPPPAEVKKDTMPVTNDTMKLKGNPKPTPEKP